MPKTLIVRNVISVFLAKNNNVDYRENKEMLLYQRLLEIYELTLLTRK
jgi:hypothetical protein